VRMSFDVIVLSKFCSRLKNELRRELIVRDVSTLKQAIQIVQDLDQSQASSFSRSQTIGTVSTRLLLSFNPIRPNLSLILSLVVPLQKIKARESQVSRVDPFSILDVSSAKDLVTFQHNVRVKQGR